jgi:hypothetical protein
VTRYVLADLEQVGAELARRAGEVTAWLDAAAGRAPPAMPGADQAELAAAIAQVDLACYHALSAAAARLASAAESVSACADAVRAVDTALAERMCRWTDG